MNDLLYLDDIDTGKGEIVDKIKNVFNTAKIDSVFDDIHGERLVFEIDNTKKTDYLKFIIKEGLGGISFYIQMAIRIPKLAKEIDNIIKESTK